MDLSGFASAAPLELWGGIECTVNRLGDLYFDQLHLSGHDRRPGDLEQIAELGIRTLRYPVLWERVAPRSPDECNWSWSDERLSRLRRLGIRPIVGLVHHGSGPRYTGLLDPGFAEGLAAHAANVARRYPWVDAYTPVNEPLTTARFSTLYGHWYPHAHDSVAFAQAMLNQCRAVVLAMRAIRAVRPDAQLIQTDDLGKSHGTAALRYQVDFENERRWLTFDLLCGRVDRHHPMGAFFLYLGIDEAQLNWFTDNPCPPTIIGLNHYLTSERFLDERVGRYPANTHGNNGRHVYADVEAVRVGVLDGPANLLREAWQRYHMPMAVTEAHLECGREEQMRWLWELWRTTELLRLQGVDIRAVTAWALLGSHDWDTLVTRPRGHYQPGVFDVRSPRPRPTALAGLVKVLASGRLPHHPILAVPGWWLRAERVHYPDLGHHGGTARNAAVTAQARPILVAGGSGCLGQAFAPICAARGLPVVLLDRHEMDITSTTAVESAFDRYSPWAVINAAGFSRVDAADSDPEACRRANVVGPSVLASACAQRGLPLLSYSCDTVFDGQRKSPYLESAPTHPLSVHGWSKLEGEREIARLHANALVVRTGPLFGSGSDSDRVAVLLRRLASGEQVAVANDQTVSPTYIPDLIHASLDLLIDGERGIWHLANRGALTWLQLAAMVAHLGGTNETAIDGRPVAFGSRAQRPVYCALGSERGELLPTLDNALARFIRQWRQLTEAVPAVEVVLDAASA